MRERGLLVHEVSENYCTLTEEYQAQGLSSGKQLQASPCYGSMPSTGAVARQTCLERDGLKDGLGSPRAGELCEPQGASELDMGGG